MGTGSYLGLDPGLGHVERVAEEAPDGPSHGPGDEVSQGGRPRALVDLGRPHDPKVHGRPQAVADGRGPQALPPPHHPQHGC